MNNSTQDILNNLLTEASTGTVLLETTTPGQPWKFGVHFYSNIEGISNALDNSVPELQISNYNAFIKQLEKYLSLARNFYKSDKEYFELTDTSYTKKLISDLFASATNYDFHDFINYLNIRTSQLQPLQLKNNFNIGSLNTATISARIKKNSSNLEGPYNMELFAQNKTEFYPLPTITFGIANKNLYIYAIKYTNTKVIEPETQKPVSTIVDGKPVLDTAFKNDMQDYFHLITQNSQAKGVERNISPNSLVSLALFLSLFKNSDIQNVIAPDFMPIRYDTNLSAIQNRIYKNGTNLDEQLNKHNNNQQNITNKFMYLFLRYNRCFPECEIYYDDLHQEIHMKLSPTKTKGDNLIYKIDQITKEPESDSLSK